MHVCEKESNHGEYLTHTKIVAIVTMAVKR